MRGLATTLLCITLQQTVAQSATHTHNREEGFHAWISNCNALLYTPQHTHTTARRAFMRGSATATHCNTLQHTATHCNTLQHTATHCNIDMDAQLLHSGAHPPWARHTTPDCSTLQHTATHCNTPQHTAAHCNTLQHTATHSATHTNNREEGTHAWISD